MTGPGDPPPDGDDLGRAYAARIGGDWQLDVPAEPAPEPPEAGGGREPSDGPAESPPVPSGGSRPPPASTPPPTPERIVEAMLFVGGEPLTAERAAAAVRGLTPEQVRDAVASLDRSYRRQGRPYAVRSTPQGYVLQVKPAYREVRERLFGGPREARLSQPALDVLSLVAYRQPVTKPELDAARGADSGAVLRQLVRLGLVAVAERGGAGGVAYGTTARFLELFHLSGLDDLPRTGDMTRL